MSLSVPGSVALVEFTHCSTHFDGFQSREDLVTCLITKRSLSNFWGSDSHIAALQRVVAAANVVLEKLQSEDPGPFSKADDQ